jgi:hypothetical protein
VPGALPASENWGTLNSGCGAASRLVTSSLAAGLFAKTGFSVNHASGGDVTPLFVCARDVKFKFVSNAVKQISVPTDIFCNVFIFGFCFNFLSQIFLLPVLTDNALLWRVYVPTKTSHRGLI